MPKNLITFLTNHYTSYYSLGLFFISILPLGFFVLLLLFKPFARTTKSLPIITLLIIMGGVICLFAAHNSLLPLHFQYISIISVLMWFIYIKWYSVMPSSKTEMKIGAIMPSLTFLDTNKNEVKNDDFINKKLIYLFYRGNWCPLCMAQIKEISAKYKALEQRGVEVLLISPQPVSHSISLAKKMGVNFHFFTDAKNAMARKLKIDHKNGTPLGMEVFGYTSETVLPTVIITNEQGEILYLNQTDNYRIRPEPSTFISVLDAQTA